MRSIVCALGIFALSGSALGGVALPDGFDVHVSWGQSPTWRLSDNPEAVTDVMTLPDGSFEIRVNWQGTNWGVENMAVNVPDLRSGDRTGAVFINSNFNMTNNTGSTQSFIVTLMQGGVKNIGPGTQITGSHAGSLGDGTNQDGATLSTTTGFALYEAQIDGSAVRTLFDDSFSVSAPPVSTMPYGPQSFINEPSISLTNSVAIVNRFDLTAGDNVQMTSTFFLVPGPGAAALAGLAGLTAIRRRRA